jgi:YggT family protein
MAAIHYIVETLLGLVVFAFLMRVILQVSRADFRNPISQAIVRITNPLVLPLRRVIPPLRKLDLASVSAVVLVQLACRTLVLWMYGLGAALTIGMILHSALLDLADKVLLFYVAAIFIYVLLSWVAPGTHSPAASLLSSICEPILAPVRRAIPSIGGLDLSPLFVLIGLEALRRLLPAAL